MTHYIEYIYFDDNAVRYTTRVKKSYCITWLKQFFKQTNKQKRFKKQILNFNI